MAAVVRNGSEYRPLIIGFRATLSRLFCVFTPAQSHSVQDLIRTCKVHVRLVGQHPVATADRFDAM